MDSLNSFIDMGGYAAFVWPAYALAVVGLVGIFIMTRRSIMKRQAELDRLRPPAATTTSEEEATHAQGTSSAPISTGAEVRET